MVTYRFVLLVLSMMFDPYTLYYKRACRMLHTCFAVHPWSWHGKKLPVDISGFSVWVTV